MIDLPPEPPFQQEQVIQQRLVDCGLKSDGFTVKYEDYLRSIEIVIDEAAGASEKDFACIHEAVNHEIVTFKQADLQVAFSDFVLEIYRPRMIADATSHLQKIGLLSGFPRRQDFKSLEQYAHAIERHVGLEEDAALRVSGATILFDPPREMNFDKFSERYGNLLACIRYASAVGDFESFMFIGNGAVTASESE